MNITLDIDWSALPNAYLKSLQSIVTRWETAANKALDQAADEFLPRYKQRVEEIYKKSVEEFYGDYEPIIHVRANSLYELLEVNITNRAFKIILHDERMMPHHSGISPSSLYDIVVEGGWHGGAPSGPNHPSPGTPFWRTPYIPDISYTGYWNWGMPAARSTPIIDSFQNEYNSYLTEANEMWQEMIQKNINAIKL